MEVISWLDGLRESEISEHDLSAENAMASPSTSASPASGKIWGSG